MDNTNDLLNMLSGMFGPSHFRNWNQYICNNRFCEGGMVVGVRFGYRRLTPKEAASGQFGPVGLRIAKVDASTPILLQIRDWIVRDQPSLQTVAEWLNAQGVLPGPSVKGGRWNEQVLLDLLRDPILWGLRRFRQVQRRFDTARGQEFRILNPEPLQKHEPTLAHMTHGAWLELQKALDAMG